MPLTLPAGALALVAIHRAYPSQELSCKAHSKRSLELDLTPPHVQQAPTRIRMLHSHFIHPLIFRHNLLMGLIKGAAFAT